MNRKMLVFIIGLAIVLVTVAAITAHSFSSYTPLYTVRMEQASCEMNFLPTEMNSLTYTTESGYELNCEVTTVAGEDSDILASGHASCAWTCIYSTCEYTCNTCYNTCPYTCGWH